MSRFNHYPARAFVRGERRTIDRQRTRARDVSRRKGADAGAATLERMLALVGQPLEVLFR